MAQYLPKEPLVAKIKERIEGLKDCHADTIEGYAGEISGLKRLLSFLDTLEVKEVDFDEIIHDYINAHYSEGCDGGMVSDAHNNIGGVTYLDLATIAKYFFELGMRVNNPITATDRGTAEEIIITLKCVEQDYRIDLSKEIEWVRNKVQKGEEI